VRTHIQHTHVASSPLVALDLLQLQQPATSVWGPDTTIPSVTPPLPIPSRPGMAISPSSSVLLSATRRSPWSHCDEVWRPVTNKRTFLVVRTLNANCTSRLLRWRPCCAMICSVASKLLAERGCHHYSDNIFKLPARLFSFTTTSLTICVLIDW